MPPHPALLRPAAAARRAPERGGGPAADLRQRLVGRRRLGRRAQPGRAHAAPGARGRPARAALHPDRVSRHGYRFVFADVAVEPDAVTRPAESHAATPPEESPAGVPFGRAAGAAGGGAARRPRRRARRRAACCAGRATGTCRRPWESPSASWARWPGPSAGSASAAGLALGEPRARSLRPLVLMVCAAARRRSDRRVVAHTRRPLDDRGPVRPGDPGGRRRGRGPRRSGRSWGLAYGLSARPPQGSGLDGRRSAAARRRRPGSRPRPAASWPSLIGATLAGASLNTIARSFQGSQVGLRAARAPASASPTSGPLTRMALGAWEGLLFGAGVVLGFTRRR